MILTHIELQSFKDLIQHLFKPFFWQPTDTELEKLASDFNKNPPVTYDAAFKIFVEHFPSTHFNSMEGLDNSDLKALLAMAISSAKSTKK